MAGLSRHHHFIETLVSQLDWHICGVAFEKGNSIRWARLYETGLDRDGADLPDMDPSR
jgi:hypothetical protein